MSATTNIRPGTIQDLPGCLTLINSLTVSDAVDEKLGFLLSRTTEEDLSQIFLNEITFVALDNEHVVGFASAFRAGSQHYEKFRREIVAVGWEPPIDIGQHDLIYIDRVAVSVDYRGQSIGRRLYERLFSENPGNSFFTFLVESPHFNQASADFHRRLGFERGAEVRLAEYCGLSNYQSAFYFRPSSKN